jgi:molybdenum-dependent DNA-binding transcriptional regulator ModE
MEAARLLGANNAILLISRLEDLFSQMLITVEMGGKAHVVEVFIYEKHQ